MDPEGHLRRRSTLHEAKLAPVVDVKDKSGTRRHGGPQDLSRRRGVAGPIPPPRSSTLTVLLIAMLSFPLLWVFLALTSRLHAFPLSLPFSLPSLTRHHHGHCRPSFFTAILPPNARLENVTSVPEGGSFGEGAANLPSPKNPTNLPALCAVIVNVTSSPSSSYRVGLFLPTPQKWNRRLLTVGNGGFGGGISWLAMAQGPHSGFASLSTDTGHNSSSTDLDWALGEPEKRTDWGWRALHGSVSLGKKIAEVFYGRRVRYSYYSGCSTGGRQGLKEIQISPESFDGVLVGAPAWYTSHMNPYALRIGLHNLPKSEDNPAHIPVDLFPALADEVVRQCDGVDGVEDGIVSAPEGCTFDFSRIQCGNSGVNESACLSQEQISTAQSIYTDWRREVKPGSMDNQGELLHPALSLSSEKQWWTLLNGSEPSPFGVGYVRDFVLDDNQWDWEGFNETIVARAERTDPGEATADQYDVTPFRRRGGKIVLYHGMADGLVPTRGTTLYHQRSIDAMAGRRRRELHDRGAGQHHRHHHGDGGETDDLRDFMRMLLVPGMQHCAGTAVDAPWNFGGAGQPGAMGTDGWSVPGFEDARHDVLLAMVDWVENGRPVDSVVATTWNEVANATSGVRRQRPVCAWPEVAVWDGVGDVDAATSWKCSAPDG